MEDNKNVEMGEMNAKELFEDGGNELIKDHSDRIENLKDKVNNSLKNIKKDTICSCSPTATTDTFLGGFCFGAFVTVCVAFATRAINRH